MSSATYPSSTGVRRSRRLAERREASDTQMAAATSATMSVPPPAPRLDSDDIQSFDGPRPAWLTGHDTRSDTLPASPKRGDSTFEPRVLPPLSQHAMMNMPTEADTRGMGLRLPSRPRDKTIPSYAAKDIAEEGEAFPSASVASQTRGTFPSSQNSLSLGNDDWPLFEPLTTPSHSRTQPLASEGPSYSRLPSGQDSERHGSSMPTAPHIGPLESGRFSPVNMPKHHNELVHAEHEDAVIPQRNTSSHMRRSVSMERERPLCLEGMPSETGVMGLGISFDSKDTTNNPESKSIVENMTSSLKCMSLEKKPAQAASVLRERPSNTAPKRVPFAEKKSPVDTGAMKTKSSVSSLKAGSSTLELHALGRSVLDENGNPIAYTIPTKRYTMPVSRKPRSSTSQSAMHRDRSTISLAYSKHGRFNTQPALHVGSRRMYALR